MEKEFIQENTALETRFISQKLDELEKIVKIGPTSREDKLARHNTYSEVDFLLQGGLRECHFIFRFTFKNRYKREKHLKRKRQRSVPLIDG